jgi:peptidoglycan/LPS O-acetylase OafA/YrhL
MAAPPSRRHDVDWLRVLAVYLLFVFHVAMVFNPAPFYHIRNGEQSFAMLVVAGFISLWHMPLFFLLAGWSAHASLASRGTAGFAKERVLRLWVPLVAGCVLLMPPIKYLELRTGLDANYTGLYVSAALQPSFTAVIPQGLPVMAPFRESFLEFLPTFFTRLERFTWAHLWFVAYLLVFTALYLPLFRWLRARRGELGHAPGWWVYLPIVPLALVQGVLRPHWPGLQNLYDDWANVAYYSLYLLAGFLLARHPALEGAVHREWPRALGIAFSATLVLLLGVLGVFSAPSVLLAGSAVAGWCFVVALLGAAHRFLEPVSAGLPYLAESAFPVYWLHQSAIVLLGYPILHLELGIAAKYALLLVASVSATLAGYHFVVRRFAITRFCVGMKPRRSHAPARRLVRPAASGVGASSPAGARSDPARY